MRVNFDSLSISLSQFGRMMCRLIGGLSVLSSLLPATEELKELKDNRNDDSSSLHVVCGWPLEAFPSHNIDTSNFNYSPITVDRPTK